MSNIEDNAKSIMKNLSQLVDKSAIMSNQLNEANKTIEKIKFVLNARFSDSDKVEKIIKIIESSYFDYDINVLT